MNASARHALSLPAPPKNLVDGEGRANVGRYVGSMEQVDWAGLNHGSRRHALWRILHHKRWRYVALATERIFCAVAIVDVGWTNTAFAYAFDRERKQIVASWSRDGIPGLTAHIGDKPATAALSWFRWPGEHVHFEHSGKAYVLQLRCGQFTIEAELNDEPATPLLLAVGPIAGGTAHCTQKSSALSVSGAVGAGNKTYDLAGGVGSFDYSNGFLARETGWRWASGHSPGLGFNLQNGYFGEQENALWLAGEIYPLGTAHFDYTAAHPEQPWHIYTDDGLLDLVFTPHGLRREDKNLLIAKSRYVQPIGCFNGQVRAYGGAPVRAVRDLVGVTEDHYSRW